jgi:hypothetical protein
VQYDKDLWKKYASAMRCSGKKYSAAEKKMRLDAILGFPGGRKGAIEYLNHVERTLIPDAVRVGVRRLGTFSFQH